MLEIGLESIESSAVFTIPDSILNSLCAGRGTSLVVDLGAQGTTITAVVDGYELKKAKIFTPIGGNMIDQAISNYLYEQKYPINPLSSLYGKQRIPTTICSLPSSSPSCCYHPKYSYSSLLSATKQSKSYLDLLYYDILKDIKGWMSFIPHYSLAKEVRSNEGLAQVGVYLPPFYELPDGTQVPSSYRLSTLVEELFFPEIKQSLHSNPPIATHPGQNTSVHYGKRARELIEWDRQQTLFLSHSSSVSPIPPQTQHPNSNHPSSSSPSSLRIEEESLSDLIYLVVSRADVDVRKDLLSNIVLCGGASLISGLSQRLTKELMEMVPSNYKVKIISNLPIERQHSTWIGGSILSICGTFNPMWITKKEYEEYGAATLIRERFYF